MALVDHMLANGVHALVLLALPVTEEADIADGDLLGEVEKETLEVDEVFAVRDEEAVGELHVLDERLGRLARMRAEEARRRGEPRSGVGDLGIDRLLNLLLGGVDGDGERRRRSVVRGGSGGGRIRVVRGDKIRRRRLNERDVARRRGRSSRRRRGSRNSSFLDRGKMRIARAGGVVRGNLVRGLLGEGESATKKPCRLLDLGVAVLLGLDVSPISSLRGE